MIWGPQLLLFECISHPYGYSKRMCWKGAVAIFYTSFWAHLCLCTVGSYASLSVCLSVTGPKLHWTKKFYLKKTASCESVSHFKLTVCMSVSHRQVCSLQRQVAFFLKMQGKIARPALRNKRPLPNAFGSIFPFVLPSVLRKYLQGVQCWYATQVIMTMSITGDIFSQSCTVADHIYFGLWLQIYFLVPNAFYTYKSTYRISWIFTEVSCIFATNLL